MKYIKMLGLAAVAAAALMAFIGAGTASADELTNSNGTTYTGALDWSLAPGTSAKLVDTAGKELDTCTKSTVEGTITTQGVGKAIEGPVTKLDWESCTFPTKTTKFGRLETKSGAVKSSAEFQVTINTIFFGSCIYGVTKGVSLGTLNTTTGGFTANAVAEKFAGSAIACPETAKWTASYVVTKPNPFIYDVN